jgi:hypothetical protein
MSRESPRQKPEGFLLAGAGATLAGWGATVSIGGERRRISKERQRLGRKLRSTGEESEWSCELQEAAMAELAWLNAYTGQTFDELLARERTHRIDSLVLAFEEAIEQGLAREEGDDLTTEEKTVLTIEALEREVNHGGFEHFFVCATQFAPEIVQALRRIGCPKVAAIAEDAIDALRLPVVSVAEIESVIYDDNDERDQALCECDGRFFEYPEPIAERLFGFIKANKSKIRL